MTTVSIRGPRPRLAALTDATGVPALVREAWPALVGALLVGTAFVVLMPAGLPYDEPAHWLNVLYYLDHHRMPVLGQPGTSYEAQMGPVAYVLYALVALPFRLMGAGDAALFYVDRSFGLILHLATTIALAAVARRALGGRPGVALLVAIAVGLNPMLLAIATSIQNDTLALLLATLSLLAIREARSASWQTALLTGVLLGVTILTKATMWPVAVGIGVLLLLRRRWLGALITTGSAVLLAGWWFVRNVVLYGDATAQAGVSAAGYSFPAYGGASPAALAQSAVTYLWLPTEYVRNTISSPTPTDLLVLLLTAVAGLGAVLLVRASARPPVLTLTLAGIGGLAVVAWVVEVLTIQSLAFRTAYAFLPFFFTAIGAVAVLRRRWIPWALAAAVMVLNGWFLFELVSSAAATGTHWIAFS